MFATCRLENYLIFSSSEPFVNSTRPQIRSLNAIPRTPPPQATYKRSATANGTPSPKTFCIKLVRLNNWPPFVKRLNVSQIRFNSASETTKKQNKIKKF